MSFRRRLALVICPELVPVRTRRVPSRSGRSLLALACEFEREFNIVISLETLVPLLHVDHNRNDTERLVRAIERLRAGRQQGCAHLTLRIANDLFAQARQTRRMRERLTNVSRPTDGDAA